MAGRKRGDRGGVRRARAVSALGIFHPEAQLRQDYRALSEGSVEAMFERRFESQSINDDYYRLLSQRASDEFTDDPANLDKLYRHAFLLLQYRPTAKTVRLANELLLDVSCTTVEDINLRAQFSRLGELAETMASNARDNSSDYVVGRVNWFISNACPMLCKGCYSPFVADTISLPQAQEIVNRLVEHGTTAVMFSGGDPLLWPGIAELVKYAHGAGLEIGLDSTFHDPDSLRVLSEILPWVGTIGVPIDGADESTIRKFRRGATGEIFTQVDRVLDELDNQAAHVRSHTVVHRGNLHDLPKIADFLAGHNSVRQWALYQYWGRRASSRINDSMQITADEFETAIAAIDKPAEIEVLSYPAKRRSMTNFMITSSGLVVTTAEESGEEFLLGSALTDPLPSLVSSPAVTQTRLLTQLIGHGYTS